MNPAVHVFADLAAASAAVAQRVGLLAQEAIGRRGRFSFVLSGGGTPRPLFEQLAQPPWRTRIEWSRVEFFWSDERNVPPEHEESNYRLAFETLLGPLQIDPARIHRMPGERKDLDAAAADHEREIEQCLGRAPDGELEPFDVALLGLGEDGHTASLFPYSAALEVQDRAVAANTVAKLDTVRLTLTYPPLNRTRAVFFLVSGAQKAQALAAVLEGPRDPKRLPAQAVCPRSGQLEWFVDAAAAERLAGSNR